MRVAYCPNCGKYTGHKRALGAGTILGAVVTGGVSLLAVPVYGKRCVICGLTEAEATPRQQEIPQKQPMPQEDRTPYPESLSGRDKAIGWLVLVFIAVVVIIIMAVGH
jgi:hypothetical protein